MIGEDMGSNVDGYLVRSDFGAVTKPKPNALHYRKDLVDPTFRVRGTTVVTDCETLSNISSLS